MGVHCCRQLAVLLQNPLLLLTLVAGGVANLVGVAAGGPPCRPYPRYVCPTPNVCPVGECDVCDGIAGTWYWLRSPDEERRAVTALYNRYCIRCHGVDGRGVWDIPDVPNFTNPRWQASRSNDQLGRLILEGRGAVMPPFRGTLSLEEACAMGRYLRTYVPGTEMSRPPLDKSDGLEKLDKPDKSDKPEKPAPPRPLAKPKPPARVSSSDWPFRTPTP
jgi:mono/diheme cytochrome c family protein